MPIQDGDIEMGIITLNNSETIIGYKVLDGSYTYEDGDYTLTNPPQLATAGDSVKLEGYMIAYTTDGETRAEYVPERVWDMLFAGTTLSSRYSKSYWIASPLCLPSSDSGAYISAGVVRNGGIASSQSVELFCTNGDWDAVEYAVRPVVVLKSDVTIDQVQKIEDQEEEIWTTTGGQTHRPLM